MPYRYSYSTAGKGDIRWHYPKCKQLELQIEKKIRPGPSRQRYTAEVVVTSMCELDRLTSHATSENDLDRLGEKRVDHKDYDVNLKQQFINRFVNGKFKWTHLRSRSPSPSLLAALHWLNGGLGVSGIFFLFSLFSLFPPASTGMTGNQLAGPAESIYCSQVNQEGGGAWGISV